MKGTLSQCSLTLSISFLMRFPERRERNYVKGQNGIEKKNPVMQFKLKCSSPQHTLPLSPCVSVCTHHIQGQSPWGSPHNLHISLCSHFIVQIQTNEEGWCYRTPNAIKFCSGDILICTFLNCLCLDSATNLLHTNNIFLTC